MGRPGYLSGHSIVVADDVASLRFALIELLARDGAEVIAVADGHRLLALLATARVDAVVTDVRMPGLGGIDVLRERRLAGDKTPFVLVSGAMVHLDLDALAPTTLLQKPFTRETLESALRRVLRPGLAGSRVRSGQ